MDGADFKRMVEHSRNLVTKTMQSQMIPGLSITLYQGDHQYDEGFGYADLEHLVPAKPETSYVLGSVMKPMTAQAIMMLSTAELKLDDQVQIHVPYYPQKRWAVTIRQILGHVSGIGWKSLEWKNHFDKVQYSTRGVIDLFKDLELEFEPGIKFEYSSLGYNLLGAVIEEVSGVPHSEYMKQQIWSPLAWKTPT